MGFNGRVDIRVVRDVAGRNVMERAFSAGSLRLSRPAVAETVDAPLAIYLVGQGAGLLGGDRVRIRIAVHPGAAAQIGPVAAQLLLPATDQAAVETVLAVVREGAALHFAAEPVIPFAGAALGRQVRIYVAASSRVLWEEFLLAGRLARGERHRLRFYRNRLAVYDQAGRLQILESVRLPIPAGTKPEGKGFFAGADGMWSAILLLPSPAIPDVEAVLKCVELPGWSGWTRLPGDRGLVIRAMGTQQELLDCRETVRHIWGKWA